MNLDSTPFPKEQRVLRILTLNLKQLPLNERSHPWRRLENWLYTYSSNYDVIAFQEAFGIANNRIRSFLHLLSKRGFHSFVEDEAPHPLSYPVPLSGSGLATVSRAPIIETQSTPFPPFAHSFDSLAQKGILRTTLLLPDNKRWKGIHIVNIHMQSGNSNTAKYIRRQYQLPTLTSVVKSLPKEVPIVVLGDMNVQEQDKEYNTTLYNIMRKELNLREIGKGLKTIGLLTTKENELSNYKKKSPNRVDYVWVSPELVNYVKNVHTHSFPLPQGKYTSDHYGLEFYLFL